MLQLYARLPESVRWMLLCGLMLGTNALAAVLERTAPGDMVLACAGAVFKGGALMLLATACSFLGKCRIVGLPDNLPKGSLVDVTYSFDKTGRISVSAREKKTNTQAKIEIERRGVLTEEELKNFIRLADQYTIE